MTAQSHPNVPLRAAEMRRLWTLQRKMGATGIEPMTSTVSIMRSGQALYH
jgi:hypothetical protein